MAFGLPNIGCGASYCGIYGTSRCLDDKAQNVTAPRTFLRLFQHRYGDRAKVAAEGIFKLSFKSLMMYGSVARQFETSRRLDALTFAHHAEVAPLPPEQADELLDRTTFQLFKREALPAVLLSSHR
ncbi:hypothetical protein [Sphingomicrobium flavum]|uniref:hypothetical protein n=1 Tax=Sphingomicrobium flavum TaxID=1229164 RepID=UPI0021ADF5D5|nr:hypothetical protein [Sphingomicrobium flavum]